MKSLSKIILALIILVSSASAQSFTQPGTVELGGDISLSSQTEITPGYIYDSYGNIIGSGSSSSLTTFSFNPYFGVMVVRGFELGIAPGLTVTNPGGYTDLNLFFAPAYNFDTKSNVYPYVEFLVGYSSAKDEEQGTSTGLAIGGDVGLKLAIKGSSLFLFKIQYISQSFTETFPDQNNFYNYYGGFNYGPTSEKYSIGTLSVGVGFRIFIPEATKVEKGK